MLIASHNYPYLHALMGSVTFEYNHFCTQDFYYVPDEYKSASHFKKLDNLLKEHFQLSYLKSFFADMGNAEACEVDEFSRVFGRGTGFSAVRTFVLHFMNELAKHPVNQFFQSNECEDAFPADELHKINKHKQKKQEERERTRLAKKKSSPAAVQLQ